MRVVVHRDGYQEAYASVPVGSGESVTMKSRRTLTLRTRSVWPDGRPAEGIVLAAVPIDRARDEVSVVLPFRIGADGRLVLDDFLDDFPDVRFELGVMTPDRASGPDVAPMSVGS